MWIGAKPICMRLSFYMPLSDDDYKQAAKELECEMAAIKAVASVESSGHSFLSDGRVLILFEAHVFHRLTKGKYDQSHPKLSSAKWNRKLYANDGAGEWDRLQEAMTLDNAAALMSTSWGAFQIMGFNHGACGFPYLSTFVSAMQTESGQLSAFVG